MHAEAFPFYAQEFTKNLFFFFFGLFPSPSYFSEFLLNNSCVFLPQVTNPESEYPAILVQLKNEDFISFETSFLVFLMSSLSSYTDICFPSYHHHSKKFKKKPNLKITSHASYKKRFDLNPYFPLLFEWFQKKKIKSALKAVCISW